MQLGFTEKVALGYSLVLTLARWRESNVSCTTIIFCPKPTTNWLPHCVEKPRYRNGIQYACPMLDSLVDAVSENNVNPLFKTLFDISLGIKAPFNEVKENQKNTPAQLLKNHKIEKIDFVRAE